MKHIYALLTKFIMTAVVLWVVLGLMTTLSFSNIMYIALTVTVLAYIIGDLLILRVSNNTIATIADFLLSLITIYMFNYFWNTSKISFSSALISAVVIGAAEWFFHKYVAKNVLTEHKEG